MNEVFRLQTGMLAPILHQQKVGNIYMFHSFKIILPEFVHGNNIFGMVVFYFKQQSKFTVNCKYFCHFVGYLHIYFMVITIKKYNIE